MAASTEVEVVAPQQVKPPNVPIGPSTVTGYSVTLVAAILAVLAFVQGDHSEQTLGTIVAGAVAGVAFVVTQIGRYLQSRELAKGAADANRSIAHAILHPPRMMGAVDGVNRKSIDEAPAGDPDHPLREAPLSDDELAAIAGEDDVDDPATNPSQGRVVPDR
jgi:hypothetical protein